MSSILEKAKREAQAAQKLRENTVATKIGGAPTPVARRQPRVQYNHHRRSPTPKSPCFSSDEDQPPAPRTPPRRPENQEIRGKPGNASPGRDTPKQRRTSSDGQKKTDGRKKKSGMTGLQTMSLGLFIVVAFLTFRTLRAPMLRLFGSSNKSSLPRLDSTGSVYVKHEDIIEDNAEFMVDSLQDLQGHTQCKDLFIFRQVPTELDEAQDYATHVKAAGIPVDDAEAILRRRIRLMYSDELNVQDEMEDVIYHVMQVVKQFPDVEIKKWITEDSQKSENASNTMLLRYKDPEKARSLGCRAENWIATSDHGILLVTILVVVLSSLGAGFFIYSS